MNQKKRDNEQMEGHLAEKLLNLLKRLGRQESVMPAVDAMPVENSAVDESSEEVPLPPEVVELALPEASPESVAAEEATEEVEKEQTPAAAPVEEAEEATAEDEKEPTPAAAEVATAINDAMKDPKEEPKSCCKLPMIIRRNIVESIEEIQRFASEHKLAVSVMEAALQMILEIAVGCAEGKVSKQMMMWALKVLNYEQAKAEAAREGEIKGRNAKIEEKYFPKDEDGVPALSNSKPRQEADDIFTLARGAR